MKLTRKILPGFTRSVIALLVLLGVCALLFPLPLPLHGTNDSGTEKDLSEPFPCQNRPCGCRSAEQCWKKCCCFSNEQKVAWAKANGVKVPLYVAASLKPEKKKLTEICSLQGVTENSHGKATSTCCQSSSKKSRTAAASAPRTTRPSSKWVMAVFAAECQGQGTPAFSFPVSILPEMPVVTFPCEVIKETVPSRSERLPAVASQPPVPPPKIA